MNDLLKFAIRPALYEKGSAVMWTDPYISKQLLQIHLNPDMDLASRKYSSIVSTAKWVLDKASKKQMNVLDLGCGPGLYSELFANKGHKVTGVDFSKNSIDYAKQEATKKKLDITYLNQHIVMEEKHTDVYRFWTHFFSHDDLKEILSPYGYTDLRFHEDVLPEGDMWNGDNVTFCIARKN
jgi:SAM-dependent methyltransferase